MAECYAMSCPPHSLYNYGFEFRGLAVVQYVINSNREMESVNTISHAYMIHSEILLLFSICTCDSQCGWTPKRPGFGKRKCC